MSQQPQGVTYQTTVGVDLQTGGPMVETHDLGPLSDLAVGRVVAALICNTSTVPGSVQVITNWAWHVNQRTARRAAEACAAKQAAQPRVARLEKTVADARSAVQAIHDLVDPDTKAADRLSALYDQLSAALFGDQPDR